MFSAVHGIISSLTCLGPMSQYGFIGVFCQAFLCILTMGPYISPLVPTPIERRYLSCPCDSCPESGHFCGIQWNPAESFLAESPAKIAIPGTIYSGGIEYSGIGTIVVPEWSTLPSPTDSATIQVDSRWNGRNGINLVGMSFQ